MTFNVTEQEFLRILTAEGHELVWWQMGCRAALVYIITLIIVRAGKKRLFGKSAAMDVVIAVILGSVMSRAINGSTTLLPAATAALVLVGFHAFSAKLAYHWHWFGWLVKGNPHLLVKDGQVIPEAMRRSFISEYDLEEAARGQGRFADTAQISEARIERNGQISIVPQSPPPRVVEVKVEKGVQIVRVEVS